MSVASTKAFTGQLAALACFTIALGRARGTVSAAEEQAFVEDLSRVPAQVADVLEASSDIKGIARQLAGVDNAIYIGRGASYPIALEGALKLKELCYIHAEGYAAGELKHGPLALLDHNVPVIALAPPDTLFEKIASNVQEVAARGAPIVLVSSRRGVEQVDDSAEMSIVLPDCSGLATPIVYSIPLQLLAYYTAVLRDVDVDRPRNLAKSVTVE